MTSRSEQAGLVAGTLRAKPALLCAVIKDLRDEKLAGSWEGEIDHKARMNPWNGMPLCAVWRDREEPKGKQWRWALRVGDLGSGQCMSRVRAMAQATIELKKRGYIMTDWKEDDD